MFIEMGLAPKRREHSMAPAWHGVRTAAIHSLIQQAGTQHLLYARPCAIRGFTVHCHLLAPASLCFLASKREPAAFYYQA